MEHPLIGDISNLRIEELQDRITDLNRKLSIAQRSGNAALVGQIRMALETFQNRYSLLQQQAWEAAQRSGKDYSDRIDIS